MLRFVLQTLPLSFFHVFRLLLFVVCLSPGFARFAWYYFVAADRVSLKYGSESFRQTIDVYRACVPSPNSHGLLEGETSAYEDSCSSNAPVVVFCTGGGWIIGYKMWGALLARALTAAGMVVVIPDMRNYPMVYIPDMVKDVDLAINWTIKNIAQYGGDPNNVVVIGQSAGGHVACMAIFRKIQRQLSREKTILASNGMAEPERARELQRISDEERSEGWLASDLRGFSAISSPLTLNSLIDESFMNLGFDRDMVHRMFGFERDQYDPFLALENLGLEDQEKFGKELPPVSIYQGTADKTVPHQVSEVFYRELRHITSSDISYTSYHDWSHTDPILEGPMGGNHKLHKDLFDNVNKWTTSPDLDWPDDPRVKDQWCPEFMVNMARFVNPF